MDEQEVIIKVIHFPRRFIDSKDTTLVSLIRESGCDKIHASISVSNIRDALNKSPECIDEWLAFSADKRTSSGWFFRLSSDDKYEVGFLSKSGVVSELTESADCFEVCAMFVKEEITPTSGIVLSAD